MADPISLATTQAAILKSAAGKAGAGNPAQSTQADAVRQDLAVMADQAKGYTQGIDAGVIASQDNRAAQARRLAEDAAAANAARAREAQLRAVQMQDAQLRAEADKADFNRQKQRAEAEQEGPSIEDEANANSVLLHMKSHTTPGFQAAFADLMAEGATNVNQVLAILDNDQKNGLTPNLSRDAVQRYATAYFKALEGGAVNYATLDAKRKKAAASATASAPAEDDGGGGGIHFPSLDLNPFNNGWSFGL